MDLRDTGSELVCVQYNVTDDFVIDLQPMLNLLCTVKWEDCHL